MDLMIKGKTALVTGGSNGIGRGIANVLADEGCNVIILARNEDKIKDTVDEISKKNVAVSGYSCDVFNDDEINSFISDFSNTLDLNSNVDRKIFHESLKWMILGHLSDLWSPWELGEVDLNANTQTFNPYEEHLVKWKKRLPKIFSESATDQVITGGNDELGGIIKSFKQ